MNLNPTTVVNLVREGRTHVFTANQCLGDIKESLTTWSTTKIVDDPALDMPIKARRAVTLLLEKVTALQGIATQLREQLPPE